MERPYEFLTPEQMAEWDAGIRRAEALRERDESGPDAAGVAAELREVADHMAETADLDATKGTA